MTVEENLMYQYLHGRSQPGVAYPVLDWEGRGSVGYVQVLGGWHESVTLPDNEIVDAHFFKDLDDMKASVRIAHENRIRLEQSA